MKYIVSKMLADKKTDYHVMDKPELFDTIESAKTYIYQDLSRRNCYGAGKICGRIDNDGVEYVTNWYKGGFIEYRLDTIEL